MPYMPPFHTSEKEEQAVYHNNSACADGRRIKREHIVLRRGRRSPPVRRHACGSARSVEVAMARREHDELALQGRARFSADVRAVRTGKGLPVGCQEQGRRPRARPGWILGSVVAMSFAGSAQ